MFVAGMSSEVARRLQKLATTMFAAVSARNLRRCGAGLQCSMHIDEPLSGVGQELHRAPAVGCRGPLRNTYCRELPLANPHLLQKGSLVGSAGSLRLGLARPPLRFRAMGARSEGPDFSAHRPRLFSPFGAAHGCRNKLVPVR